MTEPSLVTHATVLLHESIELLDIHPNDVVVDGTFGGGGHSALIKEREPSATLVSVDLDERAHTRFDERFASVPHTHFVSANFRDADAILENARTDHVDRVLLDLGTSAFQLTLEDGGFSFNSAAPLRMSFAASGSHTGFTAYDIVNSWDASSIADILYFYGEERKARRIAAAIVSARASASIETARDLAEVIERAAPRTGKIHPATRTFQALRIAVNDELAVLKDALLAWWARLSPGGRIAVITFHSLEDRIVKQWMKGVSDGRPVTKKPVVPGAQELQANPRARSAKLRVLQKL